MVAYFDNNLQLHRTKFSNADKFYEKHLGDLLTPPTKTTKDQIPPLERFEFSTDEKTDLVYEGLGWITIPAGIAVAGWAPQGVRVLTRRAMI